MIRQITQLALICILANSVSAFSKDKITGIKLNVYPASKTIRANETAILHAEFFGTKKQGFLESLLGAAAKETKLQSNDWKIEFISSNGGVFSKPFLYQEEGKKTEGGLTGFLSQSIGAASAKDAVLYNAPSKPGKYTIRLTEGDFKEEVTIDVVAADGNKRLGSWIPSEKPNDKYLEIAEQYAPFIAQETWFVPIADFILRFDYDDNWKGDDNWENLENGSRQAFVYYAVMETNTHWFLNYNFFHARDYSDVCVIGTCHENDNEGLILTIRKDGTEFGRLELMETLAHNNVYTFTNERRIQNNVHDIDGGIELYKNTHPIVFIEAGGHGVYSASYKSSLFDVAKMDFKQNTGITYSYSGSAQGPRTGNERNIGYALLQIETELWAKGSGGSNQPNESLEDFFEYRPFGNRPATSTKYIAGAFKGRTASDNMARPFWAFRDKKTEKKGILSTGQWALDPAYSISKCLKFPTDLPVSTDYIYNPFLQTP